MTVSGLRDPYLVGRPTWWGHRGGGSGGGTANLKCSVLVSGSMNSLNVVMVGVQHPHMFHRIKYFQNNVNLIGFFDEDEATAAQLAAKYPSVRRFFTLEDLFGEARADACFVHALDHDVPYYARKVMKVCPELKGIFLEKPGAAVPPDLYALQLDFAPFTDLVVEFGWEMHYSETMDYTRQVLKSGALGEITLAHFHGGTPAGGALEKWQCLDTTLGGFVYTDGSHTFEQVVDLFGLPKRVVASVRKLPLGKEEFTCVCIIDDLFGDEKFNSVPTKVGLVKWEDIGCVILEYADKNVTLDFTCWEAKEWCADWTTDIYGTNGILHTFLNPPKGDLYLRNARGGFAGGESRMETHLPRDESNWVSYFEKQIEYFLERCLGRKHEKCDMEAEVKLMKLLEAVFRSVDTGGFVELE